MNAHVSLNLLNKLGKSNKMRGLPSILSLFGNKFNKFNNTGLGPSIHRLVTDIDTGKCIYWKYIVEAELSKLTYVED